MYKPIESQQDIVEEMRVLSMTTNKRKGSDQSDLARVNNEATRIRHQLDPLCDVQYARHRSSCSSSDTAFDNEILSSFPRTTLQH